MENRLLNNEYYTEQNHGPYEFFELGDFDLQSGQVLRNARLAYAVHGELNEDRSNAILFTIMFVKDACEMKKLSQG